VSFRGKSARCLVHALPVLLPAVAGASEGAEEASGVATLVWQGINLILLLGVLVYLTRQPIQDFFSERRERVRDDLDSAARVLADAESRLAQWQERASRLDAEVEGIRRAARERAAAERESILADAETAAERIRSHAHAAVDQEVARAQAELRAEAGDLATRLAGDLLRSHVTDADQRQLVDEFVARIDGDRDGPQGLH